MYCLRPFLASSRICRKNKEITGLPVIAGGLLTTAAECEEVLAKEGRYDFLRKRIAKKSICSLKGCFRDASTSKLGKTV